MTGSNKETPLKEADTFVSVSTSTAADDAAALEAVVDKLQSNSKDDEEEAEEVSQTEGQEEEDGEPSSPPEPAMICGYTEEFLLENARKQVEERTKDWEITKINEENELKGEDRIPKFHRDEIEIGKLIGKGGYFYVIEVNEINLREDENNDNHSDENENENGEETKENCDKQDANNKAELQANADEHHHELEENLDDYDVPISPTFSGGSNADENSMREIKMIMPEYDSIMSSASTTHSSRRRIRKITQKMENYIESGLVVQNREFMAKHCMRMNQKTHQKECRYALKMMKPEHRQTPNMFVNTTVDLAIEAKFLAAVRHPNIIKMRAMSMGPDLCQPHAYIILDRLYHTLTEQIHKIWKKKEDGGLHKVFDFGHKRQDAFFATRLAVAYDIANALHYLHELNIIYRDLKPNNIGFDVRGDAKLFDFGLATEYDPDKEKNKPFKLTGDTGTIRYMAPEVAQKMSYNELADCYSFGILLWEICAMKVPYDDTCEDDIERKVVMAGVRPKIDQSWPAPIRKLLHDLFASKHRRPKMDVVCDVLMKEINKLAHKHLVDSVASSSGIVEESARSALSDRYFD